MNNENETLYKEAFDYLLAGDHEMVVYGVLKRLHVAKGNPLYDDLVQEGRMAFIQHFIKAKKMMKDPDTYLAFIYQGVYWTLIDVMRKQRAVNSHVYDPGEDDPLAEMADGAQTAATIDATALIESVKEICTLGEWNYLYRVYYLGMNITEIAAELGVNRKRIYKYRQNILQKIGELV